MHAKLAATMKNTMTNASDNQKTYAILRTYKSVRTKSMTHYMETVFACGIVHTINIAYITFFAKDSAPKLQSQESRCGAIK